MSSLAVVTSPGSVFTVRTVSTTPALIAAAAVTRESFPPERSATGRLSHQEAVRAARIMPSAAAEPSGPPPSIDDRIQWERSVDLETFPAASLAQVTLARICFPSPSRVRPVADQPKVAISLQADCRTSGAIPPNT